MDIQIKRWSPKGSNMSRFYFNDPETREAFGYVQINEDWEDSHTCKESMRVCGDDELIGFVLTEQGIYDRMLNDDDVTGIRVGLQDLSGKTITLDLEVA